MLNTFPDLLTYGFFAPTILRLTVAIVLFYLAYHQWRTRVEIAKVRSFMFPTLSIIFNVIVGIALFVGGYTQIAALLAIIGFCIGLWLNRRHPHIVILSNTTVIVLIVVCVSLLLTGAGALAMDIPL
jgi:uncharacterized membrane protein YphA (DoxX/SURF4 family)